MIVLYVLVDVRKMGRMEARFGLEPLSGPARISATAARFFLFATPVGYIKVPGFEFTRMRYTDFLLSPQSAFLGTPHAVAWCDPAFGAPT